MISWCACSLQLATEEWRKQEAARAQLEQEVALKLKAERNEQLVEKQARQQRVGAAQSFVADHSFKSNKISTRLSWWALHCCFAMGPVLLLTFVLPRLSGLPLLGKLAPGLPHA